MRNLVKTRAVIEDESRDYPSPFAFWIISFLYASFAALTFQKLVLPLTPEFHAGNGLLHNDATYFHTIAVQLATQINTEGWKAWTLFPGAAAHVGILAGLYALFGPDPAWFIPINAAAHATGAMLIYMLGFELWKNRAGKLGGLLAGSCYLIFPSALQWYGQIHRDAFVIAGTLMILLAWLRAYDNEVPVRYEARSFVLLSFAGVLLVGLFRPYFPVLVAGGLLISFLLTEVLCVLKEKSVRTYNFSAKVLILITICFIGGILIWQKVDSVALYQRLSIDIAKNTCSTPPEWSWQSNQYLPANIDRIFGRLAELRVSVVHLGSAVGAGSGIDTDIIPSSCVEVITYLPRALWVGLFAPFPSTWAEHVSAPRLVGAIETAVWYLISLGSIITFAKARSYRLFAGTVFTFSLMAVLAFVHPNVGTLYRMRYGLWMYVLLCGALGWAHLVLKVLSSRKSEDLIPKKLLHEDLESGKTTLNGINRVAASGALVLVITFACYIGFLIRDLLLINQLGLGSDLDALVTSIMIPMFFITFLAMPLADAFTVPFLSAQNKGLQNKESLLRHLLGFAILLLGCSMILIILVAPFLTRLVLGDEGVVNHKATILLSRCFAPILLVSAWTVVGNAALNCLNRQNQAALGQWFVPVVTIVALGCVPKGQSVQAAVVGMLLGSSLNVLWVVYQLKSAGISFFPNMPSFRLLAPVLIVYRHLLFAGFLPAILVPMNYSFAAGINAGSVSAWAFTSKIVVLFSGLASVVATSVVLPHLAGLLIRGGQGHIRRDANILLLLSAWAGGLLSVGVFLFAEPLVAALLSKNLYQNQVVELTNIVKVGSLQLPMVIAGALITKLAIVANNSKRMMYAVFLGFIANLLVNIMLVSHFGVMGVAVGAMAGTATSTTALILSAHRSVGLKFKDVAVLLSTWLVWVGVCVGVTSRSAAALTSVLFAVAGMTWAHYFLLKSEKQIKEQPV